MYQLYNFRNKDEFILVPTIEKTQPALLKAGWERGVIICDSGYAAITPPSNRRTEGAFVRQFKRRLEKVSAMP